MGLLAGPLLWLGGRSCWTNYRRHPKHFQFILLYRLWVWADLCEYLSIYLSSSRQLSKSSCHHLSCRVHLCIHLNARAHEQWNCNSSNQSFCWAAECICAFIWMLELMNNEIAIVVISLELMNNEIAIVVISLLLHTYENEDSIVMY